MSSAQYPSLKGRVVFITGGASGIGADMVRAFAQNQAKVAFVDIQNDTGIALASELTDQGHTVWFEHCDVVDVDALRHAIDTAQNELGPIAVLVNNAANDERHTIDSVTPDYWDQSHALNLRPLFFAAQAVRPQMQSIGFGSIINFSSIAWRFGGSDMVVYTTAKAAIVGLTRSLARGFGDDMIRVNAIEPGAVITPRQRELWFPEQEQIDDTVARQCLKKVLLGDEIAKLALFLASDDSAMITKQSIAVDAGLR